MFAPLTKSTSITTLMGLSIAVPHTSPSPCAACVSPSESSAPVTSTGNKSSVPSAISRISILPPTRRGGTTECRPASAGASPTVPTKGFRGTVPPPAKEDVCGFEESYFQM
ncbi:unannotated protein [freshwater metagenome]|uniref:Unannotated protein n=1 Tax=freshwater metagenome TaxID=449393 RepID=A0A6J6UKK0_9ZZZZ